MARRGDHDARLRHLRQRGEDHKPFRGLRGWLLPAFLALGLTAGLPFVWPGASTWLARTTPALSLFFFLSAVGWWFGMKGRSFTVSGAFVLLLYAATAWAPIAFVDVHDFTVLALLSSFAIFALAGFNLVFVLEEIVFDAHRLLPVRHRLFTFVPEALIVLLVVGLPIARQQGLLHAPTVWLGAVLWMFVYVGWWTFRAFVPVRSGPVLRELHLLTIGTLAAAAVVDLARLLRDEVGFLPSFLMYGVMVLTWIYVSYTSLQRAHFLLRARNAVPWMCLLLSASFALLQHAHFHYSVEGLRGVQILLEQRIAYLVFGIWVGIAFYVLQSGWRVLRDLRDNHDLGARSRILAGSLARLFEGVLTTEKRLEGAAARVYTGMDRLLPRRQTTAPSWGVDAEGVVRIEADSEE
ncbi:MAG: hypothetical protein ACPHID_06460 [Thermoplasmatota archaeon]